MALVRKKADANAAVVVKDYATLLGELAGAAPAARRRAALDLGETPAAAEPLSARLTVEPEKAVREAIVTSLIRIGNETAVEGLLPLLRSDDAGLRNDVIEALQQMAESVGPFMEAMLSDTDPDVRIFAVNILEALRHERSRLWLEQVVANDPHINVCATAVDLLAEIGTPESLPTLQALLERFGKQPYIRFAVDTAVSRIKGAA